MLDINKLRQIDHKIIAIGSHGPILQSMLDFDYMSGKAEPSVVAIIAAGRKYERLFWGRKDILIPVYSSLQDIPQDKKESITLFLNVTSGRRTLSTTLEVLEFFPNLLGGTLFAENVPENHSLQIYKKAQEVGKFVIGPASVGLLLPNHLKLSAIAGTQAKQFVDSQLFKQGNVAVFSSSGGMTNEMIRLLSQHNKHVSFSLAFGGDRFPVMTPKEAFLAAQNDAQTEYIVYFGELGGYDEYDLATLMKEGKVTKKVITYIAGSISEMFETPPQFGHAKAMASKGEETAQAKRKVLREAGAMVGESFTEFVEFIKSIDTSAIDKSSSSRSDESSPLLLELENRKHSLFVNSISGDQDGVATILGENLLDVAKHNSFASIVSSMLLGKKITSPEMEKFTDLVLKLLVDHGPYVSGAVNTMITARAGKDLVSSLVSGLLTIGPRFGGAINEAAQNWLDAVVQNREAYEFVETNAKLRKLISGIGHRKYRIDLPDPRVNKIIAVADSLTEKKHLTFALEVQKITTAKKGNLILNVDGAIAAVLLDILSEKEGYSAKERKELVNIEFFNAFFVLARAVGFTAHYLDQRRLDEGLFRLGPEDISSVEK